MESVDTKYQLLILDYGGTYSFDYDINCYPSIMAASFGKVPNDDQQSKIQPQAHLLAKGAIDTEEYVRQVATILGVDKPSSQAFEQATLAATFDPSPAMKSVVAEVRRSGIKVCLLSNMYLFEVLKTKASGRYQGFDRTIFSAEAGLTKSDPDLFRQVLADFSIVPDRTLFVDDIAKYTAIATSLGIDSITADKATFSSAAQLAESIMQKLGLTAQPASSKLV